MTFASATVARVVDQPTAANDRGLDLAREFCRMQARVTAEDCQGLASAGVPAPVIESLAFGVATIHGARCIVLPMMDCGQLADLLAFDAGRHGSTRSSACCQS